MNRYVIGVYDRAGEFENHRNLTWTECLETAARCATRYPRKVVLAFNLAHTDLGVDGLSEWERETIEERITVIRS